MSQEKSKCPYHGAQHLTTTNGAPVLSDTTSLTAGPQGPILLQDWALIEKMAHQNRERIPERTVHAKGSGAFGTFTVTDNISCYTKAKLFSSVGNTSRIFIRFSTVAGECGAADAERDVRGFAIRFYTEEGNWDIVGNNTPVFFLNDPYKFADFIHTQKRDPKTHLRCAKAMWDYWSLSPEALHQITILFSDRGIPQSYRHMNGYGSHTFSMINKNNERVWVKFHFKTCQGIRTWTDEQAAEVIGADRESAQRDLVNAIEKKDFPKWTMYIQVMTEAQAKQFKHNPFDLTKIWPHSEFPLIKAGMLELNELPENYFAEVEQAALSPSNLIPGIGASPDRVLQARIFSYPDAHRYRIGVNYQSLPVNAPICPLHNNNRDGAMRSYYIHEHTPYYTPNHGGMNDDQCLHSEPPLPLEGAAGRYPMNANNDHYEQAGNLFRIFDTAQKQRLCKALAGAMCGVPEDIIEKQLSHFTKADPAYGQGVRDAIAACKASKK